MRLKEIKPGMAIHCKNDEEKKALLEEAERLGYVWYHDKQKPTEMPIDVICNTIHFYDANKQNGFTADYKHITHSVQIGDDAIEFSDLILPELTAEEVLKIVDDICETKSYNENNCSPNCPFCHGIFCRQWMAEHPTETVEICAQWKSNHDKKEPEIEWVYRVFGAENYGEVSMRAEDKVTGQQNIFDMLEVES